MVKKKQSKKDRMDESLGERRGAEKKKKQSYKDRRDESKGSKTKKKIMNALHSRDYSLNTRAKNS